MRYDRCPKCGQPFGVPSSWAPLAQALPSPTVDPMAGWDAGTDLMKMACPRCRFTWTELPLDRKQGDQDE